MATKVTKDTIIMGTRAGLSFCNLLQYFRTFFKKAIDKERKT